MDWPLDADGDALRRLNRSGFDFEQKHWVDFNIDLKSWPPEEAWLVSLRKNYRQVSVIEPTAEFQGYVEVRIFELLTYDMVIDKQKRLSDLAENVGGVCESWGVLQE